MRKMEKGTSQTPKTTKPLKGNKSEIQGSKRSGAV